MEDAHRQVDDSLVDFDPHDLTQIGMLRELSDRASVTAADDQHAACIGKIRH